MDTHLPPSDFLCFNSFYTSNSLTQANLILVRKGNLNAIEGSVEWFVTFTKQEDLLKNSL